MNVAQFLKLPPTTFYILMNPRLSIDHSNTYWVIYPETPSVPTRSSLTTIPNLLKKQTGVNIHMNSNVTRVERQKGSLLTLHPDTGDKVEVVHRTWAIERHAGTEKFGLEELGVEMDRHLPIGTAGRTEPEAREKYGDAVKICEHPVSLVRSASIWSPDLATLKRVLVLSALLPHGGRV
ncbi:hypothetical protein OE88DRAFT_1739518 [Heliocybe sulcata]|uniref:Uncharacterized protein n=1 Tax=Heliocybe sulcata TaxID=5364 RepID=A0A5C3MN75_9AGAM|nr:hypothetical protein OE88DRAFT_1739518 [Heliocybe sulcata]